VAKEQNVTETNRPIAIVLGKLILVELSESFGQTLLRLRGERGLTILPVGCDEFREFVRALDHLCKRPRNKFAVRVQTSHFANKQ
jgi:hypothetical protein